MLDLLIGLGLLMFLIKGYRRGFLKGAVGLVVLVVAALVGYRSGPAAGALIESWTSTGALSSRLAGSIAVFVLVLALGTIITRGVLRVSAPLRPLDRIAGALVAGGGYALVTILALLLVSVVPVLPSQAEGLMSGSRVAQAVTAEGMVGPAISSLLGDRALESFVNLKRLVGKSQVVLKGDDLVDIPPATGQELEERPDYAQELFREINLTRISEGVEAVSWSEPLARVAASHGREMYERGYFSHVSPSSGSVDDRLVRAGIPFQVVGENLALSPTVASVHEGLVASESHRATMLEPGFTRVGLSALEGPLGLLVVQVFTDDK